MLNIYLIISINIKFYKHSVTWMTINLKFFDDYKWLKVCFNVLINPGQL